MTRVAVSILNHNSSQSTVICVQSLLAAEKVTGDPCQLEIFVSDNASSAEDQKHLKLSLEKLSVVNLTINDENLGFAAGHNRNIEKIFTDCSPDYIWLLNNDCLVSETALHALIKCAQNSAEVGIWGATLLEADGKTIQCAGGCFYNTWISSYRQYGRGRALTRIDQLRPVKYDYIAGASLFFPIATLQSGLDPSPDFSNDSLTKRKQWLNEEYFLYFEELDLAKRLKLDYKMAWCKDALITHTIGASTGTADNQRSSVAEYHSTLSALKFTQHYYPNRLWLMIPIRYFTKCLQLIIRGDFKLIRDMTRACLAFWKA